MRPAGTPPQSQLVIINLNWLFAQRENEKKGLTRGAHRFKLKRDVRSFDANHFNLRMLNERGA